METDRGEREARSRTGEGGRGSGREGERARMDESTRATGPAAVIFRVLLPRWCRAAYCHYGIEISVQTSQTHVTPCYQSRFAVGRFLPLDSPMPPLLLP